MADKRKKFGVVKRERRKSCSFTETKNYLFANEGRKRDF